MVVCIGGVHSCFETLIFLTLTLSDFLHLKYIHVKKDCIHQHLPWLEQSLAERGPMHAVFTALKKKTEEKKNSRCPLDVTSTFVITPTQRWLIMMLDQLM